MNRAIVIGTAVLGLAVGLVGCTSNETPDAASSQEMSQQDLLANYALDGLSAPAMIDHLDRMPVAQRPDDLIASVMPDHLLLATQNEELAVELPADEFYLSIAPYISFTHECHFHSLTTCLGELSNADITVKITDETGEIIHEEHTQTFDNGFVGVWVPSATKGHIEITYDGKTGSTSFSATQDAATCITDLQLS